MFPARVDRAARGTDCGNAELSLAERNSARMTVNWRFTTAEAHQVEAKHLYPKVELNLVRSWFTDQPVFTTKTNTAPKKWALPSPLLTITTKSSG